MVTRRSHNHLLPQSSAGRQFLAQKDAAFSEPINGTWKPWTWTNVPHEKFLYFVVHRSLFNLLAGKPENVITRPDSGILSYVCTVHEGPEERPPCQLLHGRDVCAGLGYATGYAIRRCSAHCTPWTCLDCSPVEAFLPLCFLGMMLKFLLSHSMVIIWGNAYAFHMSITFISQIIFFTWRITFFASLSSGQGSTWQNRFSIIIQMICSSEVEAKGKSKACPSMEYLHETERK